VYENSSPRAIARFVKKHFKGELGKIGSKRERERERERGRGEGGRVSYYVS